MLMILVSIAGTNGRSSEHFVTACLPSMQGHSY